MEYQALYRRYRPSVFGGVIGQEHITRILKNQVAGGRISHAYLLCGTRGTGKTSVARILSRAVNCLSPNEGEPCMECAACRSAMNGSVDIVEIDAASNNGVDNIRDLIEKVEFTPLELKYKVYIIDEVHMLSGSAFNALLKTLEEPPAHAIFILATTEPQKVLPTIISRCQRMDFHRLSVNDIMKCMRGVLESAGAHIDDEGMLLIARAADGGMRDALSLADQCISFIGQEVTASDVYTVLGSMEDSFLFDMTDALIGGDAAGALRLLDRVVADGRDIKVFAHDLSLHFRAVLMAKLCGSCTDILDCTADAMERYLAQAQRCGEIRLLRAAELLMDARQSMAYIGLPRVLMESVIARIARPEEKRTVDDLLERMDAMEQKLREGVSVNASASPTVPDAAVPPERSAQRAEPQASTQAKSEPKQENNNTADPEKMGAKELWEAVSNAFYSSEPAAALLMRKAVSHEYDGCTLVAGFDKKLFYDELTKPKHLQAMDVILKGLRPELSLRLVILPPQGVKDKARTLFGDDITII